MGCGTPPGKPSSGQCGDKVIQAVMLNQVIALVGSLQGSPSLGIGYLRLLRTAQQVRVLSAWERRVVSWRRAQSMVGGPLLISQCRDAC